MALADHLFKLSNAALQVLFRVRWPIQSVNKIVIRKLPQKTQIDIITVLPGIIVTLLFCAVLRCVT
jgi:hypothetical protein